MVTRENRSDSADAERTGPVGDAPPDEASWRGLLLGVKGGIVATVAMSAFREPISKSPPPTAWFWRKFVAGEGDPEDYPIAGLVLHVIYGVGGGVAFGGLLASRLAAVEGESKAAEAARERRATLWGLVYGLALSQFGLSVVLKRLLGMDLAPDERFVFHVSHVVYGLTLGTWFGSNA
jgi:hypothetical protein